MPRKPRIEISGGLYHVITRGNNRRKVFRSHDDYVKLIDFLTQQKSKLPFHLYAYCLMPNHVHLLLEMQEDRVSGIMQRVLTSYSRYHNRKYRKVGHVFQGRYKSILCQSDRYLGELVRYIHLNPVRGHPRSRSRTSSDGERVLDIACGNGLSSRRMAAMKVEGRCIRFFRSNDRTSAESYSERFKPNTV